MPKIAILSMCIGADYRRAMEPGLQSKRDYAKRHGYDFLTGGEDVWDRSRPISWSKLKFIQKYLNDYDYLFWSDADVIILNQDLRLEDHVLPLLPAEKDLLWTRDACNNLNAGHMLIRGRSAWAKDMFERAYNQPDLIYHIWWDTGAIIRMYETNPADAAKMETLTDQWKINAYVFTRENKAYDPSVRLYKHGDFLIHFAGVYSSAAINKLMLYAREQAKAGKELDPAVLEVVRQDNAIRM